MPTILSLVKMIRVRVTVYDLLCQAPNEVISSVISGPYSSQSGPHGSIYLWWWNQPTQSDMKPRSLYYARRFPGSGFGKSSLGTASLCSVMSGALVDMFQHQFFDNHWCPQTRFSSDTNYLGWPPKPWVKTKVLCRTVPTHQTPAIKPPALLFSQLHLWCFPQPPEVWAFFWSILLLYLFTSWPTGVVSRTTPENFFSPWVI